MSEEQLELAILRLRAQTLENLAEYGLQDVGALLDHMMEELGEVARERIEIKRLAGRDPSRAIARVKRMGSEAIDLGALCLQLVILGAICIGEGPKGSSDAD
jgi:hypothetical protein